MVRYKARYFVRKNIWGPFPFVPLTSPLPRLCNPNNRWPGWGAIRKWPLIRPSQSKLYYDQTKVRSEHRVHSKCPWNSDQALPDGNEFWSDRNQTIVQKIMRSWPRPYPDHRPDSMDEPEFPLRGPAFPIWQLDSFGSDQSHQTLDVPLIRMLPFVASWQSHHISLKNKKSKEKNPLEIFSGQTNVRLSTPVIRPTQTPLIRPLPSLSDLWSYHPLIEMTSDHTIVR